MYLLGYDLACLRKNYSFILAYRAGGEGLGSRTYESAALHALLKSETKKTRSNSRFEEKVRFILTTGFRYPINKRVEIIELNEAEAFVHR